MDSVVISHSTPLSQEFGYAIILGLGFVFALGMSGTTFALKRYLKIHLCSGENDLANWIFGNADTRMRCKRLRCSVQLGGQ